MGTINRILIPIDSSEVSRWAIARAALLLSGPGVSVRLTAVVETGEAGRDGMPSPDPRRHQEVREALEAVRHQLARGGVFVRARLRFGNAADEILREAGADGTDLVVMSTHGRVGSGRRMEESVALRVVRSSPVPVLLFRPFLRPDGTISPLERFDPVRFERILVLLDGSESAERVLPSLRAVAAMFDSRIVLLRAIPGGPQEGAARRAAEEYLGRRAAAMEAEGRKVSIVIRTGAVAEEALAHLFENPVDAVAMTTRGGGAAAQPPYGSTAERLLARADVPLLLAVDRLAAPRRQAVPVPEAAAREEGAP